MESSRIGSNPSNVNWIRLMAKELNRERFETVFDIQLYAELK